MKAVFETFIHKADLIFKQVEKQDIKALQTSCLEYKQTFLSHLDTVKSLIASFVQSKQRSKASELHLTVKDARIAIERSIRSNYFSHETALRESREHIILVAKTMIKLEKALTLADDVFFSEEISSSLESVIDHAKKVVLESKTAAEAMQPFAKMPEWNHDSHLSSGNRKK